VYNIYSIPAVAPIETVFASIWTDDHFEPNLAASTSVSLNFTWTCQPTSSFQSVIYSLVPIDGEPLPPWVSVSSSPLELTLATPEDTSISEYKFGLQVTAMGGGSVLKSFYVTVRPCEVTNWEIWGISYSVWSQCKSEYEISNGGQEWKESEQTVEGMITQAVMGAAVVTSMGASILSMSSPQGAFSIINQFQLFILLPLIGAYLPFTVINSITGMSIAMFSFSFIPFDEIPMINTLFNVFDYDQSDDYFDTIGLTSGSAFLNHVALLIIIGIFVMLHFSILPWYKASRKSKDNRCIKWFMEKLFNTMTFCLYVRLILEAYVFICLSTISELNEFDISTGFKTFSLSMGFMFALCLLVMIGLSIFHLIVSSKTGSSLSEWYFREFTAGMKPNIQSKIYTLLFMLIRIAFVSILIVFSELPVFVKSILFTFLQLSLTVYLIIVRPFENVKDSILEICNQIIFLVAVGCLIHFDTKPEWGRAMEKFYLYLIMAGPLIGTVISLIDLGIKIVKKINHWKQKDRVKVYQKQKVSSLTIVDLNFKENVKLEESKFELKVDEKVNPKIVMYNT
jgi:hypothetical protein